MYLQHLSHAARLTASLSLSLSFSLFSAFVLNGSQYNSMLMLSLKMNEQQGKKTNNDIHIQRRNQLYQIVFFFICYNFIFIAWNVYPESMIQGTVCVYVCLCIYIRFEGVVFILTKNQNRTCKKRTTTTTTNGFNNGNSSSYNNSSYCASG